LQPTCFIDELLYVHRNRDALGNAASRCARFSGLRNLCGLTQSSVDFRKTGLDGLFRYRAVHGAHLDDGHIDALLAGEVEQIRSNLVALMGGPRSQYARAIDQGTA
jgi:hypothetical protein